MFCEVCGARKVEGASFCGKCGSKFVKSELDNNVVNSIGGNNPFAEIDEYDPNEETTFLYGDRINKGIAEDRNLTVEMPNVPADNRMMNQQMPVDNRMMNQQVPVNNVMMNQQVPVNNVMMNQQVPANNVMMSQQVPNIPMYNGAVSNRLVNEYTGIVEAIVFFICHCTMLVVAFFMPMLGDERIKLSISKILKMFNKTVKTETDYKNIFKFIDAVMKHGSDEEKMYCISFIVAIVLLVYAVLRTVIAFIRLLQNTNKTSRKSIAGCRNAAIAMLLVYVACMVFFMYMIDHVSNPFDYVEPTAYITVIGFIILIIASIVIRISLRSKSK